MECRDLAIPDVKLLTPKRFEDGRGWFSEVYNRASLAPLGLDLEFVQDNQSLTRDPGTIRGLHFQKPPHAQAKLLRVLRGSVYDVAVDIRAGSPTYGRHVAVELTAADGTTIFVPTGFAHGFMTLEADTEILYKVSAFYAPAAEGGILALDPALAIAWPFDRVGGREAVSMAARDAAFPGLADVADAFAPGKGEE
jgi:dTDP-4-dehydrorhamnose 3,5-epimerase